MNTKTKILKYLTMFIAMYLVNKYVPDNNILVMAFASSILLAVLDMYAPSVTIQM